MAYQFIYTCQDCGTQFIRLYSVPKRFAAKYCEQCIRRRNNIRRDDIRVRSGPWAGFESEAERKKTHPSTMPDLLQIAQDASEQHLTYGELVARRYMNDVHNHRPTDK